LNQLTDQQLLREYAEHRSEAAFAELVRRHVDLVYSAAVRTVGDVHQAEDVTQSAFIALAKESPRLVDRPVLSGWLYSTAQHLAAKVVRSEVRRRAREQEASVMNKLLSTESEGIWENIASHFDKALAELSEPDRDALLLRYFERKSAREMAAILSISEDAAQKRVNRAVERLRRFFARRGIAVGASGLAGVISTHAIQAAPLGLTTTVSSAVALAETALHTSTLMAATKTMAMTTLQKSFVAATILVVAGAGIYETRHASVLQQKLQAVQRQSDAAGEQIQRLQSERDAATAALAAARNEIAQARAVPSEVLALRADIARLRGDAQARAQREAAGDPTGATAKSWLIRLDQLKQRAATVPGIPELELLTVKDWLDAVKDSDLETEADFRQAMSKLRNSAKSLFGNMTREALRKYAAANGGFLPADWSQLKPYFEAPMDDAIFERYALLQTGKLSDVAGNQFLFAEKAPPVDDEYDSFYEFRMSGTRSSNVNPTSNAVKDAALQFAAANGGLLPKTPSELTPYFKQPIDSAAVQKILDRIPPGVTTLDQLQAGGTLSRNQ
jgi:RNA polymerase sigma factor (sigma-70 family)